MFPRIARLVALSLPLIVACVLAMGGLRVHDGRVERSSHVSTAAATPVETSGPADPSAVGQVLRQQLTVSVPWPAFAALLMLCLMPAIASLLAWSGSRRGRRPVVSASRGAP